MTQVQSPIGQITPCIALELGIAARGAYPIKAVLVGKGAGKCDAKVQIDAGINSYLTVIFGCHGSVNFILYIL
jgi:hypothetical protein